VYPRCFPTSFPIGGAYLKIGSTASPDQECIARERDCLLIANVGEATCKHRNETIFTIPRERGVLRRIEAYLSPRGLVIARSTINRLPVRQRVRHSSPFALACPAGWGGEGGGGKRRKKKEKRERKKIKGEEPRAVRCPPEKTWRT